MKMTQFERLALNILPKNYKITVKPDFHTYKFDGHVVIDLEIKSKTEKIELNSAYLSFDSASYEQNGVEQESDRIEILEKQDLVVIHFKQALEAGFGRLSIKYGGTLNDNMYGFYRVKYKHSLTTEPYTATTQFETCGARRAFPCFDEPSIKATFDMIVIAEANKTVLSNMPLKEIQACENDAELRCFVFERTPIMSTYLLAFVVGEYGSISSKLHNGASITVYTPLQKEHLGEFALEIAIKSVKFYSEYFGIEYPLPKLDLIAVPENPIEAMENWGLIIFNEANMLLDKKDYSFETKIVVAYITAHEIAHQWFGNIVTMDWWSDLWLNEGFATWAGYFATDHCLPNYDIWTSFVCDRCNDAFELDSLVSTHPIEVPINDPSEIDEIFDAISYDKGACVLQMLREYIGDEAFRAGLHSYLEAFKYSNARTDQLWSHLSESSKKPINDFMSNWTQKDGFPCVKVERGFNEKQELILTLTQSRFFANGINSLNDSTVWKIPITVATKSSYPSVKHRFALETKTESFNLGVVDTSEWLFVNVGGLSYHRTHYQTELIDLLKEDIQKLNSCDRLMLQSNYFALAQAGFINTAQLLDVIKAYRNEENPNVWNNLTTNLFNLSSLLVHTEYFDDFKNFVIAICKPFSLKIGWVIKENEDVMISMSRENVHLLLSVMGDEDSWRIANKLYADEKAGKCIPAALRKPAYTAALLSGNEDTLQEIFKMYENSHEPEETTIILKALSFVREPTKIEKILEFAFTRVTFEDTVIFMKDISKNPCSQQSTLLAWNFLRNNFKKALERYDNTILLGRLIKPIIERFNSNEAADDVKEFFKKNPARGAEKQITQGIEQINIRSAWLTRICNEKISFI